MPTGAHAALQRRDVADALAVQVGLVGEQQEVDDDARGVEPQPGADRVLDHLAEQLARELGGVHIGDVGAHDQRGLGRPGDVLQMARLAGGELDRIGRGVDQGSDRGGDVLDAAQERALVEKPVVDGHIEAAPVGREQAIESREHDRQS